MRERDVRTQVHLLVIAPPLRGVTVRRVNILERDGEVDEEEIKVVNPPEAELLLCQGFHLVAASGTSLTEGEL